MPERDKTVTQMRPQTSVRAGSDEANLERASARRRYGAPQVFAATLLLLFLVQCGWFVANVPLNQVEGNYILRGIALLHGSRAADPYHYHSPLVSEAAVAGILPIALHPAGPAALDQFTLDRYRWLVRAPFLLAGLMLGASVWYIARRLYGNGGGYVAISLYCFTPGLVARSSLIGPEILGAWGTFSAVFASIAVAHTLYAPRDAFLWNRKRIAMLGIAIGIMVGAQFALALVLPLALAFMLWAVPGRRRAAAGILTAACVIALIFLWAVYCTNFTFFGVSVAKAEWASFARPTLAGTLSGAVGGFSCEKPRQQLYSRFFLSSLMRCGRALASLATRHRCWSPLRWSCWQSLCPMRRAAFSFSIVCHSSLCLPPECLPTCLRAAVIARLRSASATELFWRKPVSASLALFSLRVVTAASERKTRVAGLN